MITKQVQIGDVVYKILEVGNLKRAEDGAYLYGHIQHDKQAIELNAELADTTKKIALIHEIIHAMLFQGGLMLDDAIEEQVCIRLSFALLDLFRKNMQLIEEICNVE